MLRNRGCDIEHRLTAFKTSCEVGFSLWINEIA